MADKRKPKDRMSKQEISDLIDSFFAEARAERAQMTPAQRALHKIEVRLDHMAAIGVAAIEAKHPGFHLEFEELERQRALWAGIVGAGRVASA